MMAAAIIAGQNIYIHGYQADVKSVTLFVYMFMMNRMNAVSAEWHVSTWAENISIILCIIGFHAAIVSWLMRNMDHTNTMKTESVKCAARGTNAFT